MSARSRRCGRRRRERSQTMTTTRRRKGRAVIVNAPYSVYLCCRLMTMVVGRKTEAESQVLNRGADRKPMLQDLVESHQLPNEYGGEGVLRQSEADRG